MEFYNIDYCKCVETKEKIDDIYDSIHDLQKENKTQIDILLNNNLRTKIEYINNCNVLKKLHYRAIKNIVTLHNNKEKIKKNTEIIQNNEILCQRPLGLKKTAIKKIKAINGDVVKGGRPTIILTLSGC